MNGDGDCFEVAIHLMVDSYIKGMVLVHGEVTGQGPIAGVQHAHAWVEFNHLVVDRSNGKNIMMPKEAYYSIGNIKNTVKYDRQQMNRQLVRHKTYGPWEKKLKKLK